jgi:hypothetical protein
VLVEQDESIKGENVSATKRERELLVVPCQNKEESKSFSSFLWTGRETRRVERWLGFEKKLLFLILLLAMSKRQRKRVFWGNFFFHISLGCPRLRKSWGKRVGSFLCVLGGWELGSESLLFPSLCFSVYKKRCSQEKGAEKKRKRESAYQEIEKRERESSFSATGFLLPRNETKKGERLFLFFLFYCRRRRYKERIWERETFWFPANKEKDGRRESWRGSFSAFIL